MAIADVRDNILSKEISCLIKIGRTVCNVLDMRITNRKTEEI